MLKCRISKLTNEYSVFAESGSVGDAAESGSVGDAADSVSSTQKMAVVHFPKGPRRAAAAAKTSHRKKAAIPVLPPPVVPPSVAKPTIIPVILRKVKLPPVPPPPRVVILTPREPRYPQERQDKKRLASSAVDIDEVARQPFYLRLREMNINSPVVALSPQQEKPYQVQPQEGWDDNGYQYRSSTPTQAVEDYSPHKQTKTSVVQITTRPGITSSSVKGSTVRWSST